MPLTDAKVRSLKSRDKDYKVGDFDGLFVLVKASGSLSWRFKYRFLGKEKLMVFGDYPAVSLARARTLRDDARVQLSAGNDPNALKQAAKRAQLAQASETFGALADSFLRKARAENLAASTLSKTVWLLDMAKADLGKMPIREITAPIIMVTLRKLEARGTYETAKRLRSMIGAVFRFAVASGAADTDPTYALKDALIRPRAKPRAAIIDEVRLGQLIRAIDGYHGQATTRYALQLLAIVAQRPGELRQAKWAEFDLVKAIWTIPAERMKMRRPHVLPLPPQAINILKNQHFLTGNGDFVFPALTTSKRCLSENTLNMALRRMGFGADEMTSHGFRATFSTLANESGLWNPDAIERHIAHVDKNAIRGLYSRGEYWEERVRMAKWWADNLNEIKLEID